jgi:hypothetical protein
MDVTEFAIIIFNKDEVPEKQLSLINTVDFGISMDNNDISTEKQ